MMEINELFYGSFYLLLTYLFLLARKSTLTTPETAPYFLTAYTVKAVGTIAFALIYQFYYGGGDTFGYYRDTKMFWALLKSQPTIAIQALFIDAADYTHELYPYISRSPYFRGPQEWGLVKIASVVSWFCFDSYLAISFIFNLFAFLGLWQLFNLFARLFPSARKHLLFGIMYAPSAVFWGSALMKDTLALGCAGFLVAAFLKMLLYRKPMLMEIIIVIVCAQILVTIKIYVLLTVAISVSTWAFLRTYRSIPNVALRVLTLPIILVIFAGAGTLSVLYIAQQSAVFNSLDAVQHKIEGFHGDHGFIAGGSSYNLGEVEYTAVGLVKKLPASLVVALFRPFPWEVYSIVMLVASAEGMVYLGLTLLIFFRSGLFYPIKTALGNEYVALALVFTFVLGYIVGFTSFNFGALVRFKIPLQPFYGIALALLYHLPAIQARQRGR